MTTIQIRQKISACLLIGLSAWALPMAANAQLATGQTKFLGNIIAGSVPADFSTYWNQVSPENAGKWGSVEGVVQGTRDYTNLDLIYNYAQQSQNSGYKFKFHNLVWGAQYPTWITSLSEADQKTAVENWIKASGQKYPNAWAVDVVNDAVKNPCPFKTALGGE